MTSSGKSRDLRKDAVSAKFLKSNLHKLVRDLPSDQYHGMIGTWSSTQFKDIIDDEDLFIKKYIKMEIPRQEREAFDTGTFFHTAVLEPHKVSKEIAVFSGGARRGAKWEAFRTKHVGKIMITDKQKAQGDYMIKAVKNSPVAQEYLVGIPEVSLFIELRIYNGLIYATKFKKLLTREGWVEYRTEPGKGFDLVVKVRADMLGDNFVSDLKSTSGNVRSRSSVRGSISKYQYDLSAALYLDMFSLLRPDVEEFIWIFANKEGHGCRSWKASPRNILVGRAKYMRGMIKMSDCARCNWEIADFLDVAEPLPHELEWLIQKDVDLL